ncbi:hypothetical protein D9M70_490300 [compost metagenome]
MAVFDFLGKRDQKPLARAEMLVGDRLADAGAFGEVAERQGVGAALAQDLLGGLDQLGTPFGLGELSAFGRGHRSQSFSRRLVALESGVRQPIYQ